MSTPSRTTLRSRVAGKSWLRTLGIAFLVLILAGCIVAAVANFLAPRAAAPDNPNAAQNSLLNLRAEGRELKWDPVSTATGFRILRNGEVIDTVPGTQLSYPVPADATPSDAFLVEPIYDSAAPAVEKENDGVRIEAPAPAPNGAGEEGEEGNPLDN